MNIGDLVRSLHGSEEGFITKIIDDKTIEIEIEDGFTLPILIKDIVVVKKEEASHFDNANQPDNTIRNSIKSISDKGIFLSFVPSSENFFDLHLVNNTDYNLIYTIHQVTKSKTNGISSGTSSSRQSIMINKWGIKDFDKWGILKIDLLYYQQNTTKYKDPLRIDLQFQAKSFFSNIKNTPIVEKKGHLYQIDTSIKSSVPSIKFEADSTEAVTQVERPDDTIDLHIDELTDQTILPHQILDFQLEVFQKTLEAAIATGMKDITFIHGNGSGKLKTTIQKILSQHLQVEYYQDAQKNKFGYGATYVQIK